MRKLFLLPGLFIILFTGCILSPATPAAPKASPTLSSLARDPASEDSQTKTPPTKTMPTDTLTANPTSPADGFAFEQNRRLGRGVNLGNALEAPVEGEWGMVIEESFFDLIAGAGFQTVRVPIRWSAHADKASPYTVDPAFFERIDWIVQQATRRRLNVILNMHHYQEIFEFPMAHKERFLAIWEQIAKRYQDQPDSVYFELLNEPNGILGKTSWSKFAAEGIALVRKTNPERTMIIGPGDWNAIASLYGLELPEADRNLIVTVHYYLPFHFTHQGAEWAQGSEQWLGNNWNATPAEKQAIIHDFDYALKWARLYRRPIFLGEFGAYYKADMDSRARWTEFIARQAEARGFSWAYWEFGAGFGVYDRQKKVWNEPLLKAMLP